MRQKHFLKLQSFCLHLICLQLQLYPHAFPCPIHMPQIFLSHSLLLVLTINPDKRQQWRRHSLNVILSWHFLCPVNLSTAFLNLNSLKYQQIVDILFQNVTQMSLTIPNRILSPSETYEQSTVCTSIGILDLCALTRPIKVHLQHTGASLGLDLQQVGSKGLWTT